MSTNMTKSQLGTRLDLQVRQGSTLGPYRHQLTQAGGVPFDLTGCTVRAKVRPAATAIPVTCINGDTGVVEPVELIEMRVVIAADPTLGFYDFGLAAEITGAMVAGENMNSPESLYLWDSELVLADGRVVPLYYGRLMLQPEVTK